MKIKMFLLFLPFIFISFHLSSQNNRWIINTYVGEPTGISVEKEFLKHFSAELTIGVSELFYDDNICEQYKCLYCTQLSKLYSNSIITKYKYKHRNTIFYFGAEMQINYFLAETQFVNSTECNPMGLAMINDPQKGIKTFWGILPNIGIEYPVYKNKIFIFSDISYFMPIPLQRKTNPQFRFGLKYSL